MYIHHELVVIMTAVVSVYLPTVVNIHHELVVTVPDVSASFGRRTADVHAGARGRSRISGSSGLEEGRAGHHCRVDGRETTEKAGRIVRVESAAI